MAKLHEILAVEPTRKDAWATLLAETHAKLVKNVFFAGYDKTLKMLEDNPANQALEAAAVEHKVPQTDVISTMAYALKIYGDYEDLQLVKNKANTRAKANLVFRGVTLAEDVPVDQFLGLESRLTKIQSLMRELPTRDATKAWTPIPNSNFWQAPPDTTTKTEKRNVFQVIVQATDKHPAQVDKSVQDIVIGTFTTIYRSGAVSAEQKANAILAIDELLAECKAARQRCNEVEVEQSNGFGEALVAAIMAPLKA